MANDEIELTPEQEDELTENKGGPEARPEVTNISEGGPDDA